MSKNTNKHTTKILFLYTEIAGYTIACLKALAGQKGVEVHMVRWPVNKEAPFQFPKDVPVTFYEREDYDDQSLLKLVHEINPQIAVCSGWIDKGYMKAIKSFKKKIPTVLTLDNHWRGDLKQRIAAMASPFMIKNRFTHAWVPGDPQYPFARKLGFKPDHILRGFYSADHAQFDATWQQTKAEKQNAYPHRFLYIGRYLDFKGIYDMWEAFIQLKKEYPNDWKLYCLGTGDEWEKRVQHPDISHFGFVQPHELEAYIQKTGVFVLPSHKEPWAVTVHEFAAAGFPLICSDNVGAATQFVENEKNGYIFKTADVPSLKQAMRKMMEKTDEALYTMAAESNTMSAQITPEKWAQTLMNILS